MRNFSALNFIFAEGFSYFLILKKNLQNYLEEINYMHNVPIYVALIGMKIKFLPSIFFAKLTHP